ncbi:hypothetical protein C0J52_09194 [Blattella germanica]|nr:hypothetical protein C0J52_09194 [Blattella germanica]
MRLLLAIIVLHSLLFQEGKTGLYSDHNLFIQLRSGDCTFRITADMGRDSPLILSADGQRFISPKRQTDILLFRHDEKVLLACPGSKNKFVVQGATQHYREVIATCAQNNTFSLGGDSANFRYIKCAKTPDSSILDAREDCGGAKRHKKLFVGFRLPVTQRFLKTVELCYDPIRHSTLYTKFEVSKGVKSGQNIPRASYFRTEVFRDNLRPNFASIYKGHDDRLRALLGSEREGEDLQKGHLAAFGHFPYYSQQDATMYAINTVPQWDKVNMGNWKRLEDRIRSLASNSDQDLHVIAGAFGVLKIKGVEIFLAPPSAVPVPQLIYAVVYDQAMSHGVVLIVVNDTRNPSPRKICRDVCNRNKSLMKNWPERSDASKGFLYCCTLREFNQKTKLAFPDKPLLE